MSFSSSFDIYLIDLILAIVNHLLWQWMQSDFMSLGCFFFSSIWKLPFRCFRDLGGAAFKDISYHFLFPISYCQCDSCLFETWGMQHLPRTFHIICQKKSFSAVSINFIRFLYNISTALGIYKLKKGTVK